MPESERHFWGRPALCRQQCTGTARAPRRYGLKALSDILKSDFVFREKTPHELRDLIRTAQDKAQVLLQRLEGRVREQFHDGVGNHLYSLPPCKYWKNRRQPENQIPHWAPPSAKGIVP